MPSRASLLAAALLVACGGAGAAHAEGAEGVTVYGAYASVGTASWYGDELAGRRTAAGDRFDPAGITAAHRTLPLGSFAEVTALDTGRSIIVRVNDRGPHRKDRLIDLSRGAAQKLGIGNRSMTMVRVRAISSPVGGNPLYRPGRTPIVPTPQDPSTIVAAPAATPEGRYRVRVATFSNASRARALADVLGGNVAASGGLWRVETGPFDVAAAQRARDAVAARGYGDAQIIAND